jgi:predicted XRE-type DNA-binding protein
VADLIRSIDLPEERKQEQIDSINARRLSRLLTVMRVKKGMNQKRAAEKCGCTQSRISKLEYKEDRKITIGELLDYSDALGLDLSVQFTPKKMKIVDRVKMHAFQIEQQLQRLVKLSKGDKEMEKAVSGFHNECLTNMLSIIGKSKKSIRPSKEKTLTVVGPPEIEQMIEEERVGA